MDAIRMRFDWRRVVERVPPRLRPVVAAGVVLGVLIFLSGTGYVYEPYRPGPVTSTVLDEVTDDSSSRRVVARLQNEQHRLRQKLSRLSPRGLYIVVDQTHNKLYLRKNLDVVFEAICSSGSGRVLKEGPSGRQWVFDTPRGRFKVLSKIENPIWRKPDWAFVEEGQPIPVNQADRLEGGVLGEYGFFLGDGYLIHGTLYERLLGRSVTHGCIRLGRDDLRELWTRVPVGTPVYIF
jgi:hypothetical protein